MKQKYDIFLVGGARPNFIKLAPICRSLDSMGVDYGIIHTGQHYDYSMDGVFFDQFGLKKPICNFNVGSGRHGWQTAEIIKKFEDICFEYKPILVVLVGDVNSTLACAVTVSKIPSIKLAHVEAGGRVFDRNMPEEVNRVVTDVLSDILFAVEPSHVDNLRNEGILASKVHLVGDVIVDNLLYYLDKISSLHVSAPYVLVTMHRPHTVDNPGRLRDVLEALNIIASKIKVIFSVHPRTTCNILSFGFTDYLDKLECVGPMDYFKFISYLRGAVVLLTDSGGAQIEAAALHVPCVTMRTSTERLITVEQRVNTLVGTVKQDIITAVTQFVNNPVHVHMYGDYANLMDGKASERIVKIIINNIGM